MARAALPFILVESLLASVSYPGYQSQCCVRLPLADLGGCAICRATPHASVVDICGTNVKMFATGLQEPGRLSSGTGMTPVRTRAVIRPRPLSKRHDGRSRSSQNTEIAMSRDTGSNRAPSSFADRLRAALPWQVFPYFGWQFARWGALQSGCRWVYMDYETGSGASQLSYDMLVQGPQPGPASPC